MGNLLALPAFQAFQHINAKLRPKWEANSKKKLNYLAEPTSTRDNASALHALFGTENSLGYYETTGHKREEVCDKLRSLVPFRNDQEANYFLKQSMEHLFTENEGSSSDPDSITPHLDQYSQQQLCKDSKIKAVLSDKIALQEYFDFLAQPEIPFVVSDLQLIAHVYGISIEIFRDRFEPLEEYASSLSMEPGTRRRILLKESAKQDQAEFQRISAFACRDLRETLSQILSILHEVYSFQNENDLTQYLEAGDFGCSQGYNWEEENDDNGNSTQKVEAVESITTTMGMFKDLSPDEKLRVKLALTELPYVCLRVIHDRLKPALVMLPMNGSIDVSLVHALGEIRDFILENESTPKSTLELLLPMIWVLACQEPSQWLVELGLVELEEVFVDVLPNDLERWRGIFQQFPRPLIQLVLELVGREDDDGEATAPFGVRGKQEYTKFLESFLNLGLDLKAIKPEKLEKLVKRPWNQWSLHIPSIYMSSILEDLENVPWNSTKNKMKQALYHLHSLYNLKPSLTLEFLEELRKALKRGGADDSGGAHVTKMFCNFSGGKWDLNKEAIQLLRKCSSVEDWIVEMVQKQSGHESTNEIRTLQEVIQILENDGNSSISRTEMMKIRDLVEKVDSFKFPRTNEDGGFISGIIRGRDHHIRSWLPNFKERKNSLSFEDQIIECLAYVNEAMKLQLGFKDGLRPNQKFCILAALYLGSLDRSLLAQMATGEGKTCVVLALAIIRGVFGFKTDIVTSSEVLAKRDANVHRKLYELFDLTVGEVTSPYRHLRQMAYKCTVVYGTSSCFQGDYIRDLFYKTGVRGDRPYGNVLIDEVDTMLLDNGSSVVYLSHDPADMKSLEDVLVLIWLQVVAAVNNADFDPLDIHEKVMTSIYPTIDMEDIQKLSKDPESAQELWDWMVSRRIINDWGRLQVDDVLSLERKLKNIPWPFALREKQLKHLIQSRLESETKLVVMDHLKPYVDLNLYTWILNAYKATRMKEGIEYVVDVTDHSESSTEDRAIYSRIIIVNLYTGVDQVNTTWSDGLHQFLQLKHGCKVGTLGSIGIFISGTSFFKLYKRKFGLTGTMGTQSDRKFLKETYNVEFLSVPSAQAKRFEELEPKICSTEDKWKSAIFEEVDEMTKADRSVLIICKTVREAESLNRYLLERKIDPKTVQLYTRDYQTFKAAQVSGGLKTKKILIATNLAGRGTDIRLSSALKKEGGLHVILSYLPLNLRVEQQALGRAARSGDPGTGRIIFYRGGSNESVDAIDCKIERDEEESQRVSGIQEQYNSYISKQEEMFQTFKTSYHALDEAMKDRKARMFQQKKQFILSSMIDKWSFWLNRYSFYLEHKKDSNSDVVRMANRGRSGEEFRMDEEHLRKELHQLLGEYDKVRDLFQKEEVKTIWEECKAQDLVTEPGWLIKVAKVYMEDKKFDEAIQYLDKIRGEQAVIAALYYKLHCMLRQGRCKSSEFTDLAERVLKLLEGQEDKVYYNMGLVSHIKCVGEEKLVRKEGFNTQKENEMKILGTFKSSIVKMIGNQKMSVSNDLGGLAEVRKHPRIAEHLERHLICEGVLLQPEFQYAGVKDRDAKIDKLALEFSLSREDVKNCLWDLAGKKLTDEVQKRVKKKLGLPYRGGFWKEIESCLEFAQTFAVVKEGGSNNGNFGSEIEYKETHGNDLIAKWLPAIQSIQKRNEISYPIIFKHGLDLESIKKVEGVIMGSKSNFKSQQKYRYLRQIGRLRYETAAFVNIQRLKELQLKNFHKITRETFCQIKGIVWGESSEIFDKLVDKCVIASDGELLTTEWKAVEFGEEFEVYRADILSVLQSTCRYKYEVLSIIQQAQEESQQGEVEIHREVRVSLPSRPWEEFVGVAIEQGFVKGLRPSRDFFQSTGGLDILQEPKRWAAWLKRKFGGVGNGSAEEIPVIGYCDLKDLFPEKSDVLFKMRDEVSQKSWLLSGTGIPADIKKKYEFYLPEILGLAQWLAAKKKGEIVTEAVKECLQAQGKIHLLDNPDSELKHLTEYFSGSDHEKKTFESEIEEFGQSGFDDVIDTVERKYTWKMIFSSLLVFFLGVVQVVAGVVIEFFSLGAMTFVASGFIQEGIGDMIECGMAFWRGRFSWQDYINNKWQSIAFTVVTMGIAKLISKGVQYSKYGARLFGAKGATMSGRVIQESLKQGAKGGVRRSVWKVLAKSVGYKILQSGAIAAGSMAVNYVYEKALAQAVQKMSKDIFAKMYDSAHRSIDERLKDRVYILCDRVGVHKTKEILNSCLMEALAETKYFNEGRFMDDFSRIKNAVWGGISQGIGKMANAKAISNTYAEAFKIVGKIVSTATTLGVVVESLAALGIHVEQLIEGVEEKLRTKMKALEGVHEQHEEISLETKRNVVNQFKNEVDKVLNDRLEHTMRVYIIEPLLNDASQKLLTSFGRAIRGACKAVKEAWVKSKMRKTIGEQSSNSSSCDREKTKFCKKLLKLSSKAREPETVVLAVENGAPLGTESLQVLANAKGVKIIVESENNLIKGEISPENGEPKATLRLKHVPPSNPEDLGHWECSSGSGTQSTGNSADCLLNAFNEEMRQKCGVQTGVTRKELAGHMRKDANFRDYVKKGYHHSFNAVGGYGGAIKSYSKEDLRLKGDAKLEAMNKLMQKRDELKREGRLMGDMGTGEVTKKMKNRRGVEKDVPVFVAWEVTKDNLSNATRPNQTMKDEILHGFDADSGDDVGHMRPNSQMGQPWNNLFAQNPDVNRGVDNAIVRETNKWIKDNMKNNPSVYNIRTLEFQPDSTRPTKVKWYQQFKLDGEVVDVKVYDIPNDRARSKEGYKPRKTFLNRPRGL